MIRQGVALVTAAAFLAPLPAAAALTYLEDVDKLSQVTTLPAFSARTLDGVTVDSAGLVGKRVVLIAFWSIYCEACVKKFGALVKIRAKYAPELLEVISVSTDAEYRMPVESMKGYLAGLEVREKYRINFPVLYEGGDELARKLGISFLPAVISVDRQGRIIGVYRRITEDSDEEIIRGIETIIPEEAREPPP